MTTIVVLDDWDEMCSRVDAFARLAAEHDVRLHTDRIRDRADLERRVRDAEVLMLFRERTAVDAALIAAAPRLRLISQTGTGVAHVDVAAAEGAGVAIATTPGASAPSVAELTIALMLAVYHRLGEADRDLRTGGWTQLVGREVSGKTLGILGVGRIGTLVADRAAALGMHVVGWTRRSPLPAGIQAVGDPTELFERSDCVSVHLRLTPETEGIVNGAILARMRPGGVLVNTARGALIVEADLAQALRTGRLYGAGLDVYAREPLAPDSPLRELANVILTPHIGWMTVESQERFVERAVANINGFLAQ